MKDLEIGLCWTGSKEDGEEDWTLRMSKLTGNGSILLSTGRNPSVTSRYSRSRLFPDEVSPEP